MEHAILLVGLLLAWQPAPDDPLPPAATARLGTTHRRHGFYVSDVVFSPDGKKVISTDWQSVGVWDAATGGTLAYRMLDPWPRRPVLSPDGSLVVFPLRKGPLEVQEIETGRRRCRLDREDGKIHSLVISPD